MKPTLRAIALTGLIFSSASAQNVNRDATWRPAALYEVFVRDFSPAGNFRGVTAGLDRIQATGADVVWLMPIYPIGKVNRKGTLGSPYSVADYRGINPDFGNAADLRQLVSAVHARKMKIILDFVPNHTAFDHSWITQHPDRYTHDKSGRISVAIDNDGKLTDWTDVADLNYDNPETRRAIIDDMRYWIDNFKIDGFRVDVAGFIPDSFWSQAVPELRRGKRLYLLAEWDAPKLHALGYDLTYDWNDYHALIDVWKGKSAAGFAPAALKDAQGLPNHGMRMRFTTNHDETAWNSPAITLWNGSRGARAAFVATAMLPGVPLLYNGQEVESPQRLPLFEKDPVNWKQPDADNARKFYRRVIEISQRFASAPATVVSNSASDDVISYRRGDALVLVNTRPRAVTVSVDGMRPAGMRDLLTGKRQAGSKIALPGYAALVLSH